MSKSDISIVTWNINGLRSKYAELCEFLYNDNPDIVMIQETRRSPRTFHIIVPGYVAVETKESSEAGNGMAILVRKQVGLNISLYEACNNLLAAHVTVPSGNGERKHLLCVNVYGPAKYSRKNDFIRRFLEIYMRLADKNQFHDIYFGGDFNLTVKEFQRRIGKSGVMINVFDPRGTEQGVCRAWKSKKIRSIDYIFSAKGCVPLESTVVSQYDASDHNPVKAVFPMEFGDRTYPSRIKRDAFDSSRVRKDITSHSAWVNDTFKVENVSAFAVKNTIWDYCKSNGFTSTSKPSKTRWRFSPSTFRAIRCRASLAPTKLDNPEEYKRAVKKVKDSVKADKRKHKIRWLKAGIRFYAEANTRVLWKWIRGSGNINKFGVLDTAIRNVEGELKCSSGDKVKIFTEHYS